MKQEEFIAELRTRLSDEMNNQYITDEKEQAQKRGNNDYVKGYIEGLLDGVAKLDKYLKAISHDTI